jgi:hypothetical protein
MPSGGRSYKTKGIDKYLEDRKKDLQKLGVGAQGSGHNKGSATGPQGTPIIRKVKTSPQGQIRARSVGVSSSSRQRTNKRGPANRKQIGRQ